MLLLSVVLFSYYSRKSDAALMYGRCYVLLLIIQEMD